MLDVMRRNSGSTVMYFVLGVIIFVFAVSFGPGGGTCAPGGGSYAAMVDGDIIRQQDFSVLYSRQVDQWRQRYSSAGTLTPEMIEQLGIKRQVLDGLVDEVLLKNEAAQRGIVVTDEELLEYLETRFGVQGVTVEQYENWVSGTFRMSVRRFEESMRSRIRGQKIARIVTDGVAVSDDELKADFKRENNRAMATFVSFTPNAEAITTVTDEAVNSYLSQNEATVKSLFEKETFRYQTDKQVTLRQIMKSLPRGATDAQVAQARTVLMDIRAQLLGGADFAALAKEHSEDEASAGKGGEMGTFGRGVLPKSLENAVFSTNAGELLGEPVKTPKGLHLLEVVSIVEPKPKAFDDVKFEVAKNYLKKEAAKSKAKVDAEALLAKLSAGESLESLTRAQDEPQLEELVDNVDLPTRKETPWVLKSQESIPRIGFSPELHTALFEATMDSPVLKKAFRVGQSYFVVQLKERELPDMTAFEGEIEEIRAQAVSTKRAQVFRDWLRFLRNRADIKLNPQLFGEQSAS